MLTRKGTLYLQFISVFGLCGLCRQHSKWMKVKLEQFEANRHQLQLENFVVLMAWRLSISTSSVISTVSLHQC